MGGKDIDLEALRSVFQDRRTWINLGKVEKVVVSKDLAEAYAKVEILPDGFKVITKVLFPAVGPGTGMGQLPVPGDLVLVAYDESDSKEEPYIVAYLTSEDDTIHQRIVDGGLAIKARPGQNTSISSDSKVLIGRGDAEETEPLVLGNVFKAALETQVDRSVALLDLLIAGPIGMGNLGLPVPTYPALISSLGAHKALWTADKATFDDFLSEVSFTEK